MLVILQVAIHSLELLRLENGFLFKKIKAIEQKLQNSGKCNIFCSFDGLD